MSGQRPITLQAFLAYHLRNREPNYIEYDVLYRELGLSLSHFFEQAFAIFPHRCVVRVARDAEVPDNVVLLSTNSQYEVVHTLTEDRIPEDFSFDDLTRLTEKMTRILVEEHMAQRVGDAEAVRILRAGGVRICYRLPLRLEPMKRMINSHLERDGLIEEGLAGMIGEYVGDVYLTERDELVQGNTLLFVERPLSEFPGARVWFEDVRRRIWLVPNERIFWGGDVDGGSARFGMRRSRRRGSRRRGSGRRSGSGTK